MLSPFSITVHTYPSPTPSSSASHTYEHPSPSPSPRNAIIFVPGLGDGPHSVPYVHTLAASLPSSLGYSIFEIRLRSAYMAFGTGDLARDVEDIRALVRYLRGRGKERIVLLGHSTGCQDGVAFANSVCGDGEGKRGGDEDVDGFILQGPVSDREALGMVMAENDIRESVAWAEDRIKQGKGREEMMPWRWMPAGFRDGPVTAYRWWSLAGFCGDDDFFSSDLPDSRLSEIWGKISRPVLILPSAQDEYVPNTVDFLRLLERWKAACQPGIASRLSGLILGANHRVDDPAAQEWLVDRVVRFLESLGGGST